MTITRGDRQIVRVTREGDLGTVETAGGGNGGPCLIAAKRLRRDAGATWDTAPDFRL